VQTQKYLTLSTGAHRTDHEGVAGGAFGTVVPSLYARKVSNLAEVDGQTTWLTAVTSGDN